jgi:hypothetical protein
VKTFFAIFVTSYFGMILLLLVLNFALPDYADIPPSPSASFLNHVMDAGMVVLGVLSWGASSSSQMFLLGFPASATILAVFGIVFRRLLSRRRVAIYVSTRALQATAAAPPVLYELLFS